MSDGEIAELDTLIGMSSYPGIISALNAYKASIQKQNLPAAAPVAQSAPIFPKAPEAIPATNVSSAISSLKKGPTYLPIENFAWDQGEYNSPTVTVYVELDGVGAVKDSVQCDFTASSFDLKIYDLNNANYRLIKDNLDKDIIPEKSKFIVKRDKVILKLAKVKGEYSYDHWTALTSKKSKEAKEAKKKDPMGGIMDMMKDMYEDGDENMKKIIGEAMMKAQRGEKSDPTGGMGGIGMNDDI
jgi:calcyclin binding protein